MNKKGQGLLDFKFVFYMMIFIVGSVVFLNIFSSTQPTKTPEQLAQEKHESLLLWHQEENKYCVSQGKELNDTYVINECRIVECKNSTEVTTFQFCSTKDNSGGAFVGGMIVGHLLFK